MVYKTRDGKTEGKDSLQDRFLQAVYSHGASRLLIRPFVCPAVSKLAGRLLETKLSAALVKPFVRANRIDLSGCTKQQFDSWNDFFTRKFADGMRPIPSQEDILISPCDGKLTVYPIKEDLRVCVKQTQYRVEELLRDKRLARAYEGGQLCVFRLSVEDYHRYLFVDDGWQSGYRRIPGKLHTVNPAANDACPIYKENTREYSLLHSGHFGRILMMEVGAMLVGRIENRSGRRRVCRGEEKGYFAFGGSTVLLMFEKGKAVIDPDILSNTAQGYETKVLQGEAIGRASEHRQRQDL